MPVGKGYIGALLIVGFQKVSQLFNNYGECNYYSITIRAKVTYNGSRWAASTCYRTDQIRTFNALLAWYH